MKHNYLMKTLLVLLSTFFCMGAMAETVTLDFSSISGFDKWGNSYSQHDVVFDGVGKVTFAAASRQTTNVTSVPVTKGSAVSLVMEEGKVIKSLKLECRQWTTKVQTITLNTSTNGGSSYTATSNTSSNFSLSASNLSNVNAIQFTFSSSSNQIGISSLEVTYETSDAPVNPATLTGITVYGESIPDFVLGSSFNHNGITVIANYDDSSTEDVTSKAVFSTPDMTTVGKKTVTVTYNGKTTSYVINVVADKSEYSLTWVAKDQGFENAEKCEIIDAGEGALFDFVSHSTGIAPAYYDTGKGVRLYANDQLDIIAKEGYAITSVTLTTTNSTDFTIAGAKSGSWTGFKVSVPVKFTASSGHVRISQIEVKYAELTELDEVTVSAAGYATYVAPMNVVIGDGKVSSYITGAEGAQLTMLAAPVVAEGEAVLLTGAGTYKIYGHDDLAATKKADNKLVAGATAPVGSYVLQSQNGKVGFYQVQGVSKATNGHAYLNMGDLDKDPDVIEDVKAFILADDATAIKNVKVAADNVTFNLQGQRVNADQKGLYIVNGKKIVK